MIVSLFNSLERLQKIKLFKNNYLLYILYKNVKIIFIFISIFRQNKTMFSKFMKHIVISYFNFIFKKLPPLLKDSN